MSICIRVNQFGFRNGMPIYEQLVRQVEYAVAEGILVPGQLIPSARVDSSKTLLLGG